MKKLVEKNKLKISKCKIEFLKFRFNYEIGGHGSESVARLECQLVKKIESFKYLGTI